MKNLIALLLTIGIVGCAQNNEPDLLIVCGGDVGDISDTHINFDFKNNLVSEKVFYKPFYLEALRMGQSGDVEPTMTREYPIEEYTNSFIEYSAGSAEMSLKITMIFDRARMTLNTETTYYSDDGSIREAFIEGVPNPIYTSKSCIKPVV